MVDQCAFMGNSFIDQKSTFPDADQTSLFKTCRKAAVHDDLLFFLHLCLQTQQNAGDNPRQRDRRIFLNKARIGFMACYFSFNIQVPTFLWCSS